MLIIPFALGTIVRIRSQAADRKRAKSNQDSDKKTPLPPSPDPDGDDTSGDSYWTRFKKWCSDHSLAIGLTIACVTAVLIYAYREEISDLVYGSQTDKAKAPETDKAKAPETDKAKALKNKAILKISRNLLVEKSIDSVFYKPEEKVSVITFMDKAKAFADILGDMKEHFNSKEITTEQDEVIKKNLSKFEKIYFWIINVSSASGSDLKNVTRYINNQLNTEVKDQDSNFQKQLFFLFADKRLEKHFKHYEQWVKMLSVFFEEKLEEQVQNEQT